MPPTNGRIAEVWFRVDEESGSPVLRKHRLLARPGVAISKMSDNLARRLEIDLSDKPTDLVIATHLIHAALGARSRRSIKAGDRITLQGRRSRHKPHSELYEHFEVVSVTSFGGGTPGAIESTSIVLKAASPPSGSIAKSEASS